MLTFICAIEFFFQFSTCYTLAQAIYRLTYMSVSVQLSLWG